MYVSNKFMSNKYSISTRSRLQGCSAPPTSSQDSLADAQRDIALLPCFSRCWDGGSASLPIPGSALVSSRAARLPLARFEQRAGAGPALGCERCGAADRRSFPAAGINTPGTSEPAGTPRSPLRGQRRPHITDHHRHGLRGLGREHPRRAVPPAPSPARDAPGTIRPWQSSAAAVSPPKVKQPRPRGSAMSHRCFGCQPRQGWGGAAPELSSAPEERQWQPQRSDTLCPHGRVQSPGLPSSSSSSSSPPLRSQPLALISRV